MSKKINPTNADAASEFLKNWTLLEAARLVQELEDKFGVVALRDAQIKEAKVPGLTLEEIQRLAAQVDKYIRLNSNSEPQGKEWSIGDARAKFSELIRDAVEEPQIVRDKKSANDERAVAVVSLDCLKSLIKIRDVKIDELRGVRNEHKENYRRILEGLRTSTLIAARLDGVSDDDEIDFIPLRVEPRKLPDFGDDDA